MRETILSIDKLSKEIPDLTRSPSEECLATFWRQASFGISYVRCELPARYLPAQVLGFDISHVGWDDERDELTLAPNRGAAVWSHMGDDARARVALAYQDLGHRTLMECDDDYTRAPDKWRGLWQDTHEQAQSQHGIGYSFEQHRHLAGLVDGMIVSTAHLAELYGEYNDNVFVCRNSVDPADWPEPEKPDDGILRIVYAGSASHVYDYPLVKKALKWASYQRDVEVYVWGFEPPTFRGTVLPLMDDLADYRRNLGRFDVGLAPLRDTDWARGKSDLKALEYAMAGVLPVVAATTAYEPWADWDYRAQPPEDWMDMVHHLVKNRDEIKPAAARAKEYVLRERTIQTEVSAWKEAIHGG